MTGYEQVALAFKVASKAHKDAFFNDHTPKIVHVIRVMLLCPPYDWNCQAVALLHDTIESGNVTSKDLIKAGFDLEIVTAVVNLTHDEKDDYDKYIDDVIATNDPLTINTKIRDLYDKIVHLPTRNVEMDEEGYSRSYTLSGNLAQTFRACTGKRLGKIRQIARLRIIYPQDTYYLVILRIIYM